MNYKKITSLSIILFITYGCVLNKNSPKILWKLDLIETNLVMCDDTSFSENSCLLFYKNRQYLKKYKFLLNPSTGYIDSVYWYGNPMGVFKMSYGSYIDSFIRLSSDTCDIKPIYFNSGQKKLFDQCNTIFIKELYYDDTLAIKNNKDLTLYYFKK